MMPAQRKVLARRTRQQRKIDRNSLGKLRAQIVQPATLARYRHAVFTFLDSCHNQSLVVPSSFIALDSLVSDFICVAWGEGEARSLIGDLISGLGNFIPASKPHFAGSWRLHGAWGRAELPCRAVPFTPLLVYGLAARAISFDWVDTAVLMVLGFSCFPRSGELFYATKGNFEFSTDAKKGVWSLPLTKSGQRTGAKEALTLEDPWVISLLINYTKSLMPGDRLCRTTPGIQRKRLEELLRLAKIEGNFKWYSLRRGGATHHFRKYNNMSRTCLMGRWGNERTARIYITDALAMLTEITLSAKVKQSLRAGALKVRPNFDDI